jgi:hypothetical protein
LGCDQIQDFLGMGGDEKPAPPQPPLPPPMAEVGDVSFIEAEETTYEARRFRVGKQPSDVLSHIQRGSSVDRRGSCCRRREAARRPYAVVSGRPPSQSFSDGAEAAPRAEGPVPRAEGAGPDSLPGAVSAFVRVFSSQTAPFFPSSHPKTLSFIANVYPNSKKPPPLPSATLPSGQTSPAAVSGRHCRGCLYHLLCPVLRPLDGRRGGFGRVFTRSTQV